MYSAVILVHKTENKLQLSSVIKHNVSVPGRLGLVYRDLLTHVLTRDVILKRDVLIRLTWKPGQITRVDGRAV